MKSLQVIKDYLSKIQVTILFYFMNQVGVVDYTT